MGNVFRLDIQGLRAIAILAVLIFHIDPARLPGGFIGVDLFFLISGYLITQHICRDLERGTFSFRNFYLRRIRRLYPALIAMVAFTAAGVYMLYLPQDAKSFGASLIATSVYASNIFFYTQSDYFDDKLHINPLLHTWSLSVEEQFYIVFPLILFFIFTKARTRMFVILASLGVLSFIVSEIVLRIDASAAFYMSPTRFGQFMAGAVVAIAAPCALSKNIREGMSWLGLALMGGSILFFSGETPFPGFLSAVPTLGAALVIYSGSKPDLFSNRLLSLPPAQFFGKISYSLYLFHWPVVLFYKYYFGEDIRWADKLIVLAACIIAGYASWRFIEVPGLKLDFRRPAFVRGAVLASIVSIIIGISFVSTKGYEGRFNSELVSIGQYINYDTPQPEKNCWVKLGSDLGDYDETACMAIEPGKRNILLIGDSHAMHLYGPLQAEFKNAHIASAMSTGCRPLLGTQGLSYCLQFREKLFKKFLPGRKYDAIILSGRWKENEVGAVKETLAELKKYAPHILVSGPVIEYSGSLPRLMGVSYLRRDNGASIDNARRYDMVFETDKAMKEAVEEEGAVYFSPLHLFCEDKKTCRINATPTVPLQFDSAHLTYEGGLMVAAGIREKISPFLK